MALVAIALGLLVAFGGLRGPREQVIEPDAVHTLAILPFKPLLPAERNESLELGMAESLIASIGQGREQAVSPLSSVRRFASLETDPLAAGRELGVDTVLDGSLQRSGDRLGVGAAAARGGWTAAVDAGLRRGFHGIFSAGCIAAA